MHEALGLSPSTTHTKKAYQFGETFLDEAQTQEFRYAHMCGLYRAVLRLILVVALPQLPVLDLPLLLPSVEISQHHLASGIYLWEGSYFFLHSL